MISDWVGIGGVTVILGLMIAGLKRLTLRYQLHPELARKLLHVGMGMVILTFPWVFSSPWPVLVLVALAVLAMTGMRLVKSLREGVGSVLMGVNRISWGEVYYPLAVGILFWWTQGDPLLFSIPILILSLADAVAALVGVRYGQLTYSTCDSCKSVEGSVGFLIVAFLSVHVPLLLFTQVGRVETLLVALVIALLVMLFEGVAWRGLDNLFIPLGSHLLLSLYLDETVEALIRRLLATVVLVVFALVWRGRSRLDDGALLGVALFGYLAWMLGGWPWLITPLSLFLLHLWFWPRSVLQGPVDTIPLVLATVITGVFWLVMYRWSHDPLLVFPYSLSFAVHLATLKISAMARQDHRHFSLRMMGREIYLAWGLAFFPLLLIRGLAGESWILLIQVAGVGLVLISLMSGLYFTLVSWLYRSDRWRGLPPMGRLLLATLGSVGMAMALP
jgi:phytol kinase